jgi:hypothetical protein
MPTIAAAAVLYLLHRMPVCLQSKKDPFTVIMA